MRAEPAAPTVFLVAPGGLRGRGGIGSLVRATVSHWRGAGLRPALRVLDSYGETSSVRTPLHLAGVLAAIAWNARRGRIALVHVHMASRGSAVRKALVVRLAARLRLPVVLHVHGSRLDEQHAQLTPWVRRSLRSALAAADRIVVPGAYWRAVLVDRVGVDARIVRVLSNAAGGPARLPQRGAAPPCRLLFVGNLSAVKGLPELLEALASPALTGLDWRLRVAGDGDGAAFAVRVAALGIAARVELLGWVDADAVAALLAEADVFVLPSHNEGLSIAMLEAMAHGCAVVTTPVGATCEAVSDGVSALLVPPGDPTQLAAALRRVISDPFLRAALQAGARQRWSEQFDIAQHCRQLLELYREVCPTLGVIPPEPRSPLRSGST